MTEIWLPSTAREEPSARVLACNICGEQWPLAQAVSYEDHVGRCYRRHEAEVRTEVEEEKRRRSLNGLLDPWNPEATEHVYKVGERMKREGRLEMKPNERIYNE